MTVQTTFEAQKLGISGAPTGVQANSVHTAINEEASAIPMGYCVVRGTAAAGLNNNALLPSAADDDILGVVLRTFENDNPANEVASGEVFGCLTTGQCFVLPEVDVAAGDDVFVNWQGGNEGQLRNDNDGGNAAQLLRARWESIGGPTSGKPAILTLEGVTNNA